jgi:hypothetical protein
MNIPKINFSHIAKLIGDEAKLAVNILLDKGIRRFVRSIALAVCMVFFAYIIVYAPAKKKIDLLQSQIDKSKKLADFSEQFKSTREQLIGVYVGLPSLTDREQWLANSVRDSLNVSGLVTESFNPMKEDERSGLIFQVTTVSLQLRFSDLFAWILRIENANPMMHIQQVDISKSSDSEGLNKVSCDIATVIPKKRLE